MIRAVLFALLALATVPAVALDRAPPAQRTGPIAITGTGSTGDVSGMSVTPAASGVSSFLSDLFALMRPQAASNAALKTSATWFSSIQRTGFYAAGDGGAMSYSWSPTNCSAPDDGYQVQPTGKTGCWIADLTDKLRPEVWGAKSTGTFDDAPALRAACKVGATLGRTVLVTKYLFLLSLDAGGNGALEMGTPASATTGAATTPTCDIEGARAIQHPDNAFTAGLGLSLGGGLNRPLIYVYSNTRSPHLRNLFLLGNKTQQTGWPAGPLNTSGTGGKLCTVQLADSAGGFVESGMTMDKVIIRDGYNCNFYQGGSRGTVFLRDVWSQYSGQTTADFSIYWVGYDSHTSNLQLGSNVGGGQWVRDGGQHIQEGTTAFLNGAAATRITGGKVNYFTQMGGNVASNYQTGIEVVNGAPYSGQGYGGYVFTGVTFDCNSNSANGGYPDVSVDTVQGVVLNAPVFVGCITSSSPIPNYNVQSLNGANVTVTSPTFGSVAANTLGFTNACSFIQGNFPVTCKWTPVLAGDSTAGSPTYSRQFGTYTRFANTETVSFALDTSALGGPAGNLVIRGLPLFSGANANDYGTCNISQWGGWTAPTGRSNLSGFIAQTTQTISLFTNGTDGSGISPATVSQFAAATRLWGTCTYRVAN